MNKLQSHKPKNKRVLKWTAALLVVSSIGGTVYAAERQAEYMGFPVVGLEVNGQAVQNEVPAINMNGSTMVPLRFVSESLGATVDWKKETSTAVILAATPSPTPAPTPSAGNNGSGATAPSVVPKEQIAERIADAYEQLYFFAGRLKDMKSSLELTYEQTTKYQDRAYAFKTKRTYMADLRARYDKLRALTFEVSAEARKNGIDESLMNTELDRLNDSLSAAESLADMMYQYTTANRAIDEEWFQTFLVKEYDLALESSLIIEDKMVEWKRKVSK